MKYHLTFCHLYQNLSKVIRSGGNFQNHLIGVFFILSETWKFNCKWTPIGNAHLYRAPSPGCISKLYAEFFKSRVTTTKLIAKCQICNVDHDLAVVMKEEGLQAFQSIKNSFLFQLRILSVILRVGSFYSNWHFWHWHWKFRAKRTVCQGREKFKIIEIHYFLLKVRKFQTKNMKLPKIWTKKLEKLCPEV